MFPKAKSWKIWRGVILALNIRLAKCSTLLIRKLATLSVKPQVETKKNGSPFKRLPFSLCFSNKTSSISAQSW